MKPVVTGADIHGIHEFEKGSIDDAGYGNPMFLAIYGFHFLCNDVNKRGATKKFVFKLRLLCLIHQP